MAAWYDLTFLEINSPFLSTISLRNNVNLFSVFSELYISNLFKETNNSYTKIKIKEKKEKIISKFYPEKDYFF